MKHDPQTIARHLLYLAREEEELRNRDPDAPDENSRRRQLEAWQIEFEDLLAKRARLEVALTKAAAPFSPAGIQTLAQLAMTGAERTDEGTLEAPESFDAWIRLFALTCAAKQPEPIPLPRLLPMYWAIADGTDPHEIGLPRAVRETSPEAKQRRQRLDQAIDDKEPAQAVRDAAFDWVRGLGASEEQALSAADQLAADAPLMRDYKP